MFSYSHAQSQYRSKFSEQNEALELKYSSVWSNLANLPSQSIDVEYLSRLVTSYKKNYQSMIPQLTNFLTTIKPWSRSIFVETEYQYQYQRCIMSVTP